MFELFFFFAWKVKLSWCIVYSFDLSKIDHTVMKASSLGQSNSINTQRYGITPVTIGFYYLKNNFFWLDITTAYKSV